ncbi:ArnT family glycosyltransferase [Butyrivibrio sp.]|uniref:ArnT family glycosyltransferase n=1 Tax=Butyrivibrio sp. TaxID=28121 RepID=UPI0025C466C5|nr:glycosyltransferase family 39 protein [Butyrivibrio sp.]
MILNLRKIKDSKYFYTVVSVVMLVLALILRLYKLSDIPRGLHVDEIGMGYDSWCIAHFGVDRYLNSFPMYLSNYGGGQSALYCYLTVPFILLGGFTPLMLRLPSVIFSMLAGIFGWRLVRIVSGKRASIIYLFIYLTIPYFTQAGRIALDCNLMLGLSVIMLNVLEYCLRDENYGKKTCFVLLGTVTGITFYSYALSDVVLPLFYLFLIIYLIAIRKKVAISSMIAFTIPVIIFAIPQILLQVVNIYGLPAIHIGPMTIPIVLNYRLDDIVFDQVKPNLRWTFDSLFRADNTDFDSFPQFGALYMFSLPIIAFGGLYTLTRLVKSVREKKIRFESVILIYTFSVLLFGLFIQGVTTYRINSAFFGLAFFIVATVEFLFDRNRQKFASTALAICLLVLYLINGVQFVDFYFNKYADTVYPQRLFAEDPTDVYNFLDDQPENVKSRLTYVGGANEAYIYYLWAKEISPYEYDHNKYGNNGDGVKYSFWAPEPYDVSCNYVMYLPEESEINALIKLGFIEYDFGPYKVYIFE